MWFHSSHNSPRILSSINDERRVPPYDSPRIRSSFPMLENPFPCNMRLYRTLPTTQILHRLSPMTLPSGRRVVHHLSLLLLESLADPLSALHILLDTSGDAAGFALDKGFGGEVVNA